MAMSHGTEAPSKSFKLAKKMDRVQMQPLHLPSICEKMLDDATYSDIIFQSGEDLTPAHRCILAAISPVFRSMFESGFVEQKTNKILLEDMDTDMLRAFLRLIYGGKLDGAAMAKYGLGILGACHKYCLPLQMKHACVEALSQLITIENCISYLEQADLYSEVDLAQNCKNFIASNLSQIVSTKGVELAQRNPDLFINLVKDRLPPEGFREFNMWYRRYNTRKVSKHRVLVPVNATVSAMITQLKQQLAFKSRNHLRIISIENHCVKRMYTKKDLISNIAGNEKLRAEEIPGGEKSMETGNGYYVACVCHFKTAAWSYEAFGEPFTMWVNVHESARRLKERIRVRLDMKEEEWETNLRLARFPVSDDLTVPPELERYVPPVYLEDTCLLATLIDNVNGSMVPLGIHHVEKVKSFSRTARILEQF